MNLTFLDKLLYMKKAFQLSLFVIIERLFYLKYYNIKYYALRCVALRDIIIINFIKYSSILLANIIYFSNTLVNYLKKYLNCETKPNILRLSIYFLRCNW